MVISQLIYGKYDSLIYDEVRRLKRWIEHFEEQFSAIFKATSSKPLEHYARAHEANIQYVGPETHTSDTYHPPSQGIN